MRDSDLDDLFAQMRAEAPLPSASLAARIEADALFEQNARAGAAAGPRRSAPRRGLAGWIGALGGRGVLAGLATATLSGIWLGLAQPAPVSAVTQAVTDAYAVDASFEPVDLLPALDAFVTEG